MSSRLGRFRTSLRSMVLLSFLLQILAMTALHTYRFRAGENHFGFGWEMGKIGEAIATGEGFSNPYGGPTGPSAWEPPLYPFLIGGVFKVFGVYSAASAWVLLALNSLFAALTCVPIFFIAQRTMNERIAVWAAWTWVLLPYEWYWSIHWIWDTTVSPLCLCLIFLVALRLGESSAARRLSPQPAKTGLAGGPLWAVFGLLWGILALLNTSCLSFFPFCMLWVWHCCRSRGRSSTLGLVLAVVVMAACLTPWLIRNYVTYGKFVFVRDDFGAQLRLGNGPFADGMLMAYLQPNLNVVELNRFRAMGELRYAETRRCEALAFIRQHPGRFLAISGKRFVYYWAGVPHPGDGLVLGILRSSLFLASSILALWGLLRAIRTRQSGRWLFALLVLSYPTVYYFVFPHARYRHPIEPELLILAVFLVLEARPRTAIRGAEEPKNL